MANSLKLHNHVGCQKLCHSMKYYFFLRKFVSNKFFPIDFRIRAAHGQKCLLLNFQFRRSDGTEHEHVRKPVGNKFSMAKHNTV